MNKIGYWLALLLCSLFVNMALAQGDSLSFTLKEAQDYAMENSYELKVKNMEVAKARKKVWETISDGLPQVSGSYDYTKTLDQPVWLIPAENFGGTEGEFFEMKSMPDKSSDFGLNVAQKIFDGSYIVGVQSAKIYVQLSKDAQEKTGVEIKEATTLAYYSVLVAKELKKIMVENEQNTQKMLSDVKAFYKNGFREEQDVDQLELMAGNANNEVLKADRQIDVALTVLKYVMGFPLEQKFELEDELSDYVDAVLVQETDNTPFNPASHIDFRILNTQEAAGKKLLKLEKSMFLPRVDAFYNMRYSESRNFLTGSVDWFTTSLVGVSVKWDLFTSGRRFSRIKQAKIDLNIVRTQQKQAIENLHKDYLTSSTEFETAVEKYKNDEENRDLSLKIYNKSKIKFNNGMENSFNLSQIESQYLQAQGNYYQSVFELLQAQLNRDKVLSKL